MRQEFSTLDIVKALNIPRERLRDWMNRGFVTPEVAADGQGTKAVFTSLDVHRVALFRNLIDYGFSREVAANFLKEFTHRIKHEKGSAGYPETVYIVFRSKLQNGKAVSDVLRLGAGAWKFDVESGYIDWPLSNKKFRLTGNEIVIPPGIKNAVHIKDQNWTNVHIINFRSLCEEVDKALLRI